MRRIVLDHGRQDLGGQTKALIVLVDHNQSSCLGDGVDNGLPVEWHECAQIDDLSLAPKFYNGMKHMAELVARQLKSALDAYKKTFAA